MQCGTAFQKEIFLCLLKVPCQAANISIALLGISHWSPNRQQHCPQLKLWDNEEEDDPLTPHTFYTCGTNPIQ